MSLSIVCINTFALENSLWSLLFKRLFILKEISIVRGEESFRNVQRPEKRGRQENNAIRCAMKGVNN